ncbi:hypothetical protein QWT69_16845 [Sporosarcina oncorhynchi]|uniref:Uncharacterized protein n=1 Tax=Sporosarcina oncorhynchi TaxID=3056444 RepID=A0ABZ0L757_9BACL|nr:hypothetical protein [Sporosarcina sp. T2O-4]WOV87492.1 hypothetical protein QWT69_16845 [Sporosarcina sp. T2O-4]
MKEFLSSLTLIISWLLLVATVYVLIISITFTYALIPALFLAIATFTLRMFSKSLMNSIQ